MPIVVGPEPAGTTAGQMIGQAGLANLQREMQLQQLAQQREMQVKQIDAQANLQKQSADQAMERLMVQGGLSEELRQQSYDQEIAKMHESAKAEAQQWEVKYTAQQRQEIQRINNSIQEVQRSDAHSPSEKEAAIRDLIFAKSGITPPRNPRDPNKPVYPEGQGPGNAWKGPDGGFYTRADDGSWKLLVRPDQTLEYLEAKKSMEAETEAAELQQKRQESIEEKYQQLREKSIGKDPMSGMDIFMKPEEVRKRLEEYFPETKPPETDWWERAKEELDIRDMDKDLPPQVGYAQAYVRTYGPIDRVPEDKKAAYLEMSNILMQARQEMQQKSPPPESYERGLVERMIPE